MNSKFQAFNLQDLVKITLEDGNNDESSRTALIWFVLGALPDDESDDSSPRSVLNDPILAWTGEPIAIVTNAEEQPVLFKGFLEGVLTITQKVVEYWF